MRAVFCTGPDVYSSIIQRIDGGDYSHCGIIMPDDTVIEATYHAGVRRRRLDSLLTDKPNHSIVEFALPDEVAMQNFAIAQIGTKYDWTGVLGIGFSRDWQDPSAWWCSELLMAAAGAGGRKLSGNGRRVGVRLAFEVCNAWAV